MHERQVALAAVADHGLAGAAAHVRHDIVEDLLGSRLHLLVTDPYVPVAPQKPETLQSTSLEDALLDHGYLTRGVPADLHGRGLGRLLRPANEVPADLKLVVGVRDSVPDALVLPHDCHGWSHHRLHPHGHRHGHLHGHWRPHPRAHRRSHLRCRWRRLLGDHSNGRSACLPEQLRGRNASRKRVSVLVDERVLVVSRHLVLRDPHAVLVDDHRVSVELRWRDTHLVHLLSQLEACPRGTVHDDAEARRPRPGSHHWLHGLAQQGLAKHGLGPRHVGRRHGVHRVHHVHEAGCHGVHHAGHGIHHVRHRAEHVGELLALGCRGSLLDQHHCVLKVSLMRLVQCASSENAMKDTACAQRCQPLSE
mmetsp:Transcript_36291/g.104508  ORF Transcript_36291/g.104508 Transcript_36291/m.104508 type:complete len:364 (+) Transcript_36291:1038-2129(+)